MIPDPITMINENATQVYWIADGTLLTRGRQVISVERDEFPSGVIRVKEIGTIESRYAIDDVELIFEVDILSYGEEEGNTIVGVDCWGRNIYILTQAVIIVWYEDMVPGEDEPVVLEWPSVGSEIRPAVGFDNQGVTLQHTTDFRGVLRVPIETQEGDPTDLANISVNAIETGAVVAQGTTAAQYVVDPEVTLPYATPVWHGLVKATSNKISDPGNSTVVERTVEAGIDDFGQLRFNTELSGGISPVFFEDAYFSYTLGDADLKGGWVALQCNRGQTNSIYAGDLWNPQSGPINISRDAGWSMYNTLNSQTLGWHVEVRDAAPNPEFPEHAYLTGRAYAFGDPPATTYGASEYTFVSNGYPDDQSNWGIDKPSGYFIDSVWLAGQEGRWTATLAVALESQGQVFYNIATHLQNVETTIAVAPPAPRVRFV